MSTFRRATAEDREAVMALYQSVIGEPSCVWNEYYPGYGEIDGDVTAGCLYVITEKERIIAAVSVVPENELDGMDCWLYRNHVRELARLAVSPACRGRGLTAKLLSETETILQKEGVQAIRFLVACRNFSALKNYLLAGYRIRSECEMYGNRYFTCEKVLTGEKLNRQYIISTSRIGLREMTEDDYEALYAVLGDSDIMRHYPYPFDGKRVRGWIAKNRERYETFGFGLWAVCLSETGEMIGDCGITMQNIHGVIRPEIGYHIRRDCQRKGYAKEAAAAVRDWAFCHTPFQRIYSYMKKENLASVATARAYGCRLAESYTDEEGEETEVYVVTKKDGNTQAERKTE